MRGWEGKKTGHLLFGAALHISSDAMYQYDKKEYLGIRLEFMWMARTSTDEQFKITGVGGGLLLGIPVRQC